MRRSRIVISAVVTGLACAAVVAGIGGRGAAAAAATGCAKPPAVYPEADVTPGLRGTGETVLRGATPTAFGVRVIGILQDGVAPGIDMYIVKLSGPVVTRAGGAFAGISGSPVYVAGQLLGSVSYALTGDFTVAGLTPAQPIVNLFSYPRPAGAGAVAANPAHRAALTPALRRRVATVARPAAAGTGSMSLLRTPIAVSGLPDAGLRRLQDVFDRHALAYTAVRGSSAALPSAPEGPPIVAGGNFAATQSFGDLTFYGLGTATAVCGDEVVAFGHPFNLTGPTSLGMNNADTITILKDPIFGGVKLANITGFQGMVDQDRLAGIRGLTGELPALTKVSTTIRNADLGTSRDGVTDIADRGFMALIAQNAVYVENLVTFDRAGSGSETMSWKVTGSFQGDPFTLTRTSVVYSPFDITYDSTNELLGELGALTASKFGPAHIAAVHFSGGITQAQRTATVGPVASASSRQPVLKVRRVLHVRPGDTVRLRVTLRHPDGTTSVTAMRVELPARFHGGGLEVRGGTPPDGCPYCGFGETYRTNAKTFADLVAQFQDGEHSNDLIAAIGKAQTRVQEPSQILGGRTIELIVG
ncbi:MAG TPA: hypothetical protein VH459_09460 [Gaiellales bacterium]|jgi:hypothetical protein